jgi:hypothetical protein
MNDSHDLRLIIESRISIIVIETWEERRADYDEAAKQTLTAEPEAVLKYIRSTGLAGLYAFCDFYPYLQGEPRNIRLIKEIAMQAEDSGLCLAFISHARAIPAEFKRLSARFSLSMPEDHKLRAAVYKIEQAIVASRYSARARHEDLDTSHVLAEIDNTVPLSITMTEDIAALRHWCQSRAVAAD